MTSEPVSVVVAARELAGRVTNRASARGYDPSRLAIVDGESLGMGSGRRLARSNQEGTCRIETYGLMPLSASGPVLKVTVEAWKDAGGRDAPTIGQVAVTCVPGTPIPAPPEVDGVLTSDKVSTTVTWTDRGSGVVYDVASGVLGDLYLEDPAVASCSAASCIASDVAGTSYQDVRPDPAPDQGYYYLVRAQNACRTGTYGYASTGVERRPTVDCP